jgi:hypothetical protein
VSNVDLLFNILFFLSKQSNNWSIGFDWGH